MKKENPPILSVRFRKDESSLPLMTHREFDLFMYSNIRTHFNVFKSNAKKIAKELIYEFDKLLNLRVDDLGERENLIKNEINKLAEYLATDKDIASYLEEVEEEARKTALVQKIEELEIISDEDYYQISLADSMNSGAGRFPEFVNSRSMEDVFIGVNWIWANKMFYDYLKSLLLNLKSTEDNSRSIILDNDDLESKLVDPKVINNLHEILIKYFIPNGINSQERNRISGSLKKALKGGSLDEKLIFLNIGTILPFAIKQLFDNGFILVGTRREVEKWICSNFKYTKSKDKEVCAFNKDTVYNQLTSQGNASRMPINFIDLSSIINK